MKRIYIVFITFCLFAGNVLAQIPERPEPARLVNDFAGLLDQKEVQQLERSLVQFARETSIQIVVVIVNDLEGNDPSDFAFNIGEQWGVGQKDKDNGLVILMKPKTNRSKGQVFISTGYGLEAVLPDAVVNRTLIDNEIIPRFRVNDYYGGLLRGINVIMDITRGEYTAGEYKDETDSERGSSIPVLIIFFVILFTLFGRGRRRRFYSPGRSLPFWLALGMFSGGRSHGGSFGNFSSGSGSFGGFGGGGFGGGGAGGSW